MSDKRDFNGSTLNFSGVTIARIRSIKRSGKAKDIEVTSLDEAEHVSAGGKPKRTLTANGVGTKPSGLSENQTGALTCTFADGTTGGTLDYAVLLSIDEGGQMDAEMTYDLEFAKALQ